MKTLKETAVEVEQIVSAYVQPSFLGINCIDEEGTIHMIVSAPKFLFLNVPRRISYIYATIYKHSPELLKNTPVIIEAFTSDEICDLIDYMGDVDESY